ncbi:Zinc finger-domain containing protein [Parasponia andersonii]|uniref:Zinc finger-domain containing protein n=1 Tax=Parasponia andersonii TaxID=3476 RepID=A0A2P5CAC7_PARAD|nr:Zinc finger-domain containing protein [Parasponia andersonii]
MMKAETPGAVSGAGGAKVWARVCDTCRAAACTVYCRADSAYLCAGCDARIHAANRVASRHERVWVCEACERAPAAFICKADAASLCATCDADIHSANPLARRHHRVPVLPISGCVYGPPATDRVGSAMLGEAEDGFLSPDGDEAIDQDQDEDEDEAASWLLLNPVKGGQNQGNGFLFGGEVDEYLDLVEYNSGTENQFADPYNQSNSNQQQQVQQSYVVSQQKSHGGDSVVPVQCVDGNSQLQQQQNQSFQLGLEFESSKTAYSYNGSISHSVSVSSMDVSVVPDSTMSDISISHPRPSKGTIDLFSGPPIQMPTQLTPMDREARVLRYREKKKTRKFEKTIRYASRKAYAETRPRIKGRFAKRTNVEVEVDQMFSTALMADTVYGIVPSF